MRRYVEWRINVYEHGYEVIREENGAIKRIGSSADRADAEAIVRRDRFWVMNDPNAVEVRGPEFCFKG